MRMTLLSWVGLAVSVIMLVNYFVLKHYIKKKTIEYDGFWGIITTNAIKSSHENDENIVD